MSNNNIVLGIGTYIVYICIIYFLENGCSTVVTCWSRKNDWAWKIRLRGPVTQIKSKIITLPTALSIRISNYKIFDRFGQSNFFIIIWYYHYYIYQMNKIFSYELLYTNNVLYRYIVIYPLVDRSSIVIRY